MAPTALNAIKLLPRGKYPDTAVGIREAGAYYSFTRKTHEYNYGSDIELTGDGRFSVGFAGGDHGLIGFVDQISAATRSL